MIAKYINQLLKIYPNYSDGTDTQTKIRGFQFVLRDSATETHLASDVEAFFQEWLRQGRKFPLPADALSYSRERQAHRKQMQDSVKALPRQASSRKRVPWYGMEYFAIVNSRHNEAFEKHLDELRDLRGERAVKDYILYLKNHGNAK